MKIVKDRIEFRAGTDSDLPNTRILLRENELPFQDLEKSAVDFIVATYEGKVIGCIGLEKKEDDGLLRSFAVSKHFKNRGIGKELFNTLIKKSKPDGIKTLHLLTTTAEPYFEKKGFLTDDRNNAPDRIKQTVEFSEICPSSSTYMVYQL